MKKLTLLALFLSLFLGSLNAQTKINWLQITDVETQIKKDGKNAKRVFIDCYTDWCGWCKKMDKDTFDDLIIATLMNHYFYCIKFDAETKDNITFGGKEYKNPNPNGRRTAHELANVLLNNKLSYPSFSVLNSDLSIITIIPGYYTAANFEPMVVFLGGGYNEKYSWEEFSKIYQEKIKPEVMKEIEKANKSKK